MHKREAHGAVHAPPASYTPASQDRKEWGLWWIKYKKHCDFNNIVCRNIQPRSVHIMAKFTQELLDRACHKRLYRSLNTLYGGVNIEACNEEHLNRAAPAEKPTQRPATTLELPAFVESCTIDPCRRGTATSARQVTTHGRIAVFLVMRAAIHLFEHAVPATTSTTER